MKTILILVVGISLGVVGYITYKDPKGAADTAKRGIDSVQQGVERISRSECVKNFESRSRCYFNKPAAECDSLLVRECGLPGGK